MAAAAGPAIGAAPIQSIFGDDYVVGRGELPNERYIFVNGILNTLADAQDAANLLSWTHNDVNMHYTGDESKGIVKDFIECVKLTLNYETDGSRKLTRAIKDSFQAMEAETPGENHQVHIIAHSKGGLTTKVAIGPKATNPLTDAERHGLQIQLVGSPAVIDPTTVGSIASFRGDNDLVPHLGIVSDGAMLVNYLRPMGDNFFDRNIFQHGFLGGPTYLHEFIEERGYQFGVDHDIADRADGIRR